MLSPPQFQHSNSSGTWYFCVHHDTTGSPHTTHSAPHQPHTKTKSTNALPTTSSLLASIPESQSVLYRFRHAPALTRHAAWPWAAPRGRGADG